MSVYEGPERRRFLWPLLADGVVRSALRDHLIFCPYIRIVIVIVTASSDRLPPILPLRTR